MHLNACTPVHVCCIPDVMPDYPTQKMSMCIYIRAYASTTYMIDCCYVRTRAQPEIDCCLHVYGHIYNF